MKSRELLLSIAFAVSAVGYFPLSQWLTTTPVGTDFLLQSQIFYLLLLSVSVLGFPVLMVCLFFQRTRRRALILLGLTAVYIPCCFIGVILGHKVRMNGMQAFTVRSQLLIAAIKDYERDHSKVPVSLEELVPKYLPRVPSTGMMAYPDYRYHIGAEAEQEYAGNPWALSVFTPSGGINFDMILYFPRQNYPERGYGGSLERVSDWAYVHE